VSLSAALTHSLHRTADAAGWAGFFDDVHEWAMEASRIPKLQVARDNSALDERADLRLGTDYAFVETLLNLD